MDFNEELEMRVEHAERCLEHALAAIRQGMYYMSACEANKAKRALQCALYETEGAALISKSLADKRRIEALQENHNEEPLWLIQR